VIVTIINLCMRIRLQMQDLKRRRRCGCDGRSQGDTGVLVGLKGTDTSSQQRYQTKSQFHAAAHNKSLKSLMKQ